MEIALHLLVCDFAQSIILIWFRIPGLPHKAVGTIRKDSSKPGAQPNASQGVNQMVTPATPASSRHCAENSHNQINIGRSYRLRAYLPPKGPLELSDSHRVPRAPGLQILYTEIGYIKRYFWKGIGLCNASLEPSRKTVLMFLLGRYKDPQYF